VTGSLKPWREVVSPHKDVASGRYQQAEFAADLWQVHIWVRARTSTEPRRVLPPHLPDREPEAAAHRRSPAPGTGGWRPGRAAADQLRRRQDALDAGALPPVLGASPGDLLGHRRRAHGEAGATKLPKVPARRAGRQQDLSRQPDRRRPTARWCARLWGETGLATRWQEGLRAYQGG
jgi:hypothetical protein